MRTGFRLAQALLASLLLACVAVVGAASPAAAHSQVVSSSPADGQRLETSPTELRFVLSEPADLSTVVVTLTGPSGAVDALGAPADKGIDDKRRQTVVVPVTTTLAPGLYRVTFTATSTFDGHTATSQLIFGVATDVDAPIGEDGQSSADPLDQLRTLLQGITLIGAGIAFGLLVLGPLAGGRGFRAGRIAAGSAGVAAVLGGIVWHTGNGLVVAVTGVVGALLLLALLGRPELGGRQRSWLVAAALVVTVAPLALVGHASVQGALMTALAAVHITTTAAWSGTVLGAAILLPRSDHDVRVSVLRRTSWVGTSTFFFALLTGLLMANTLVPSVAGLFGSVYGWGLVAKSLLVVPVLLLALYARARLRRRRSTSVVVEAGLLLVIVVLGVFVASQPPPAAAKFQPTPSWSADTAPVAVQADDLLVTAQIDPNSPGTRFVVVKVDDTRRPSPGPVTAVSASVGIAAEQELERGDDGLWTGRVDVTEPGPTSISVVVSRDDFPDAVANTTWTVAPAPGTLEGGSALTGYVAIAIAMLVASSLLVLILEGFASRRRGDDEEPTPDDPANGEVPATVV